MTEHYKPVVIDTGSGICKAGFAGDKLPSAVFPSIVGCPIKAGKLGVGQKDIYVGKEVEGKHNMLKLKYPVQRGVITDWDAMEQLWHHTFFKELGIAPVEPAVLIAEPVLNSRAHREKTAEIMFERFNTPALYLSVQQELALIASLRMTGLVLDSGFGITHAVPVHEGFTVPHAVVRMKVAGQDLTNYLMKVLRARSGYSFTKKDEHDFIRDIKEQKCYIALDFEQEVIKAAEAARRGTVVAASTAPPPNQEGITSDAEIIPTYKLPDVHQTIIGDEIFRCPEALFKPSPLLGVDTNSMPHTVYKAIMKCDSNLHKELYGNIILAGGSTMYPGLAKRLSKELSALAPSDVEVNVIESANRNFATWKGGSLLASVPSFVNSCVTRADYDEVGAKIVHRKCF